MTASRLKAMVVSEGISLDQFTSRVTAFNMFETLPVSEVPSLLIRAAVVAIYELREEAAIFEERVRIVAPSGSTLAESINRLFLAPRVVGQAPNSHRSIHTLWRVRLDTVGDYRVTIEHRPAGVEDEAGWTEVGGRELTVHIQVHPVLNTEAEKQTPSMPPTSPE